jgi:hypothetical protein
MTIEQYNDNAERSALGVLIERPDLVRRSGIQLDDLNPARGHHEILSALYDMAEQGRSGNLTLLAEELRSRGVLNRVGDGEERGHVYLLTLWSARGVAPELPYLAEVIRTATTRRKAQELAARVMQLVTSQPDPDSFLDGLAAQAIDLEMLVNQAEHHDGPLQGLHLVRDIIQRPIPPRNWVIPGILEHMDRVLLVAPEGIGKSVLSRQVGACLAAGVHPFAHKVKIPAKRVLLIDLENPEALSARGLRDVVGRLTDDIGDRYHVWNWPQGLDIRSQAGRSLLIRAIEQTRPDLISVGPLYKLSLGKSGDSYELAAQETATVLDSIRQRYNCALWIEHHMAKGEGGNRPGNPLGSSYWMRWPEFGPTLVMDDPELPDRFRLGRYRGDRERRWWPSHLQKNAGQLLWTADYDDHPEDKAELYRLSEEALDEVGPAF